MVCKSAEGGMNVKPIFPLQRLLDAGLRRTLTVGSIVGSQRWPYASCHPGAWMEPHKGSILNQNDIRAWTATLAFSGTPSQDAVDSHVTQLHNRGLLLDCVPVLWTFWDQQCVHWSQVRFLVPAEEDRHNWLRERSIAFDRCGSSHLAAA